MKRFPIPADRRVEARGILFHRRFSLAANNTLPTKGWLSFHSLKIGSLPKRRESIRKGQMPHRVMNMELQIVNIIAIQFHSRANHQGLMHKSSTASVLLLGVCFIRDFIEVRERCLLREDSIVNGWLYQSINDTVVCWNKDYAYQ